MEGSIVYSQRCIYLSINLLFQTTTYVYGNWYIAKKKTINSCSWRATLLLSLPKPWWKPIRIFTEWKGKKNKCIGYVMGWRWNLIIATFCRHWWILFFFFFSNRTSYILLQTSSPYISQLESRSRACFTFPSCFTASLSLIYLTYTNKNTPVKGKKPQPVDYHQKCPSQIWQASTRIACHFDTLASLKTKLPR